MPGRTSRYALAALLLTLALPLRAAAQTGQIAGRVLDSQSGRPLPAARVAVQGTAVAALSTVDGRYTLRGVPAGEHTVTVTLLSYGPKTLTGVHVASGGVAALDVTLAPQGITLTGITATAVRERGSVSRALDEQRTATGIVNATTSEQMARSPDADAAQAVQRVSGVTVQDGRYVFVRGLGERYTTASLNGSRIPSPDPEKKVVPLDLFPSNLLESITTSKTFTPDQPGDFSGAAVNLRTRQFPTRRTFTLALNGGLVAGAGSGTPLFPGATGDWWGNRAGERALPPIVASAGRFQHLSQGDLNLIVSSFRNQWSPSASSLPPNASGALTLGGEEKLFGRRFGYVGAFTYSRSQEIRRDEQHALAVPGSDHQALAYDPFFGQSGTTGVLWGGLLNLTTFLGTGTKLELNNSYDRASDSEARLDWGSLEEFTQIDSVRRTSLTYVERSVLSDQLRGQHSLFRRGSFDWSLTASRVTRDQPDRTDLLYGREQDVVHGGLYPLAWLGFLPYGARRSFMDLTEFGREAQGNLSIPLGSSDHEGFLKLGGAYRRTHRIADASAYDIRATGLTPAQRALSPEEIFDGRYTQPGDSLLTVDPNTQGGFYEARDHVAAGYLMGERLFGRLKLIGGARVERWSLDMVVQPTSSGLQSITRRSTDVLPSLAVNVALGDEQNLRFSASQTLARPEYRELAPVQYYSLAGERPEFGNANLQRTRVQNLDARWELYPNAGEVMSLAFFAKHFDQPIERIEVAASGANLVSYANASSAMNYGAELELRKGLGMLSPRLDPFTVFTNATVMRSRIHLGNDSLSAATNADRPMVGQAPYVLNAGLSYATGERGATSATLLYNVVGKRIWAAAQVPLAVDAYEMPRQSLDFSLRFPLLNAVSGKLDAENLLDSPVQVKQGDVVRLRYRTGRTVAFGVMWHP